LLHFVPLAIKKKYPETITTVMDYYIISFEFDHFLYPIY